MSEALALCAPFKETPKNSVNKINDILMQYFQKSKTMQKIHDEQYMKILNKGRVIREIIERMLSSSR